MQTQTHMHRVLDLQPLQHEVRGLQESEEESSRCSSPTLSSSPLFCFFFKIILSMPVICTSVGDWVTTLPFAAYQSARLSEGHAHVPCGWRCRLWRLLDHAPQHHRLLYPWPRDTSLCRIRRSRPAVPCSDINFAGACVAVPN